MFASVLRGDYFTHFRLDLTWVYYTYLGKTRVCFFVGSLILARMGCLPSRYFGPILKASALRFGSRLV